MISSPSSPYKIKEGEPATLVCTLHAANPNTNLTWKWTRAKSADFAIFHGQNYTISNITREKSGLYSCTASNTVGPSKAATVNVDVQCMYSMLKYNKPSVNQFINYLKKNIKINEK